MMIFFSLPPLTWIDPQALQGQMTGHQTAIDTLRKTAESLITSEGDLLSNSDEIQETVGEGKIDVASWFCNLSIYIISEILKDTVSSLTIIIWLHLKQAKMSTYPSTSFLKLTQTISVKYKFWSVSFAFFFPNNWFLGLHLKCCKAFIVIAHECQIRSHNVSQTVRNCFKSNRICFLVLDDIVERYDNLSKSVSDRNEKLQITLTRSMSVQDGLDEMMGWMEGVEASVKEKGQIPLDSASIGDILSKEAVCVLSIWCCQWSNLFIFTLFSH